MSADAMDAVVECMRAALEQLGGSDGPLAGSEPASIPATGSPPGSAAPTRAASKGGDLLRQMLLHHLGWTQPAAATGEPPAAPMGKLVRPRLCLLSCRAVGGDFAAAVPGAAAVELIHNFSLIHDDIEDRDEMRRGRPTVWKVYGEAQAINAGDCMYCLAYAALTDPDGQTTDAGRRLRAVAILSEACVRLCEGQSHDLALHDQPQVSEAEYVEMVARKTGALMSCAAQIGAVLGGADDPAADAFREFGAQLGIAFQIRDDILGIWGDPAVTGKPVGADLSRKRCSYPVVWALARGGEDERQAIRAAQGPPSADSIARAVAELERLGAREHAEGLAARTHERAWNALAQLHLQAEALSELRELTEFLAVRTR